MDRTAEDRLRRQVSETLRLHKEECLDVPGVVGVGMGWRESRMSFVIQAERIADVPLVRQRVPNTVDNFPVFVELVTDRVAASAPDDLLAGAAPCRSVPIEAARADSDRPSW
jgi:hypothetical protein